MFGKEEVYRFCFRLMDENKNGLVEIDEFLMVIDMIQDHSPGLVPKLQMDRAKEAFTKSMKCDPFLLTVYQIFVPVLFMHPTKVISEV